MEVQRKIVVGLGNPGSKYQNTRHNIGFEVLAELARRHGMGGTRNSFHGESAEISPHGLRLLLLAPMTYMNRSGRSVAAARDFYKLPTDDILIVCDDLNLPTGKLRIRARGSAGGQKGLADIIRCLGTDELPRLRIGIGEPPPSWDAADYVLGKFTKPERTEIDIALATAADAVIVWAAEGVETCMNRYN